MRIKPNNLIFNSAYPVKISKKGDFEDAVSSRAMTILSSLRTGAMGGIADFSLGYSLTALLHLVGVSSTRMGLRLISFNGVSSVCICWIENCISPIIEEVLFRGLMQEGIKKGLHSVLKSPTREVHLGLIKLPVASLISVVVTAILFGFAHYLGAASLIQVVVCATSGLLFGLIKEHSGLVGSVSAHVVSNLLV